AICRRDDSDGRRNRIRGNAPVAEAVSERRPDLGILTAEPPETHPTHTLRDIHLKLRIDARGVLEPRRMTSPFGDVLEPGRRAGGVPTNGCTILFDQRHCLFPDDID